MDIDLIDFCDRWLETWTGNRPHELVSFYAEDAYYSDPSTPQGLQGRGTLLDYFTKLLRKNPDWIWKRTDLYPYSEGFILMWKASIPRGDRSIECRGMDRVQLRDRKIVRNEVFFDPTPLIARRN